MQTHPSPRSKHVTYPERQTRTRHMQAKWSLTGAYTTFNNITIYDITLMITITVFIYIYIYIVIYIYI